LDDNKLPVHELPKFKEEMMNTPMKQKDFLDALKNIKTSVSNKNLEEFKTWF